MYVWYKTLVKFLKKLGFSQLRLDYGIFMSIDKQLFIFVYIDDSLIFGLDISYLEDV